MQSNFLDFIPHKKIVIIRHHLFDLNTGQVAGQVFTKNRLKEVKYEKYKSISILY